MGWLERLLGISPSQDSSLKQDREEAYLSSGAKAIRQRKLELEAEEKAKKLDEQKRWEERIRVAYEELMRWQESTVERLNPTLLNTSQRFLKEIQNLEIESTLLDVAEAFSLKKAKIKQRRLFLTHQSGSKEGIWTFRLESLSPNVLTEETTASILRSEGVEGALKSAGVHPIFGNRHLEKTVDYFNNIDLNSIAVAALNIHLVWNKTMVHVPECWGTGTTTSGPDFFPAHDKLLWNQLEFSIIQEPREPKILIRHSRSDDRYERETKSIPQGAWSKQAMIDGLIYVLREIPAPESIKEPDPRIWLYDRRSQKD